MPVRNISSNLLAHLQQEAMTLALCVKLTRVDGTIMGFTTYDHNLILSNGDGTFQTYDPSNSFEPTSIRQEASQGVDNVEIDGILKSTDITDSDVIAGKYDDATVQVYLCNYRSPADGAITMLNGTIGEITFRDGSFTCEIRSLSQFMQQQIGELISPTCRVLQLGDARCKIALGPYQFARTITVIDSVYQFRVTDASVTDYYTYGRVWATSGANSGLGITREIKDHNFSTPSAIIVIQEAFPYPFTVGDNLMLEAGCDRQLSSCRDKFANLVNFRAEPYVPGVDQLLRFGRKA